MEEKIRKLMEQLDQETTAELLQAIEPRDIGGEAAEIGEELDELAANRIKNKVFAKAGLQAPDTAELLHTTKPLHAGKPLHAAEPPQAPQAQKNRKTAGGPSKLLFQKTALLAAGVLLFLALSLMNFDVVIAAVNRFFSFIPGYGIVENQAGADAGDAILYVADSLPSAENQEARLSLQNAVAGKDSLTVLFEVEWKNLTEEALLAKKQEEWERLQKEDKLTQSKISLYAGSQKYEDFMGSSAGGSRTESSAYTYKVAAADINTDTVYRLEHEGLGLSLEFALKDVATFEKLTDIGATDIHHNIAITAVPEFTEDQVTVELYPLNKSNYQIQSFSREWEKGYGGLDLRLLTSSGPKSYTLPESFMGPNTKFTFDLEPEDRDLVLDIPFILVQSHEYRDIKLPIPAAGEKLTVNQKVEFGDCTMTIADVAIENETFGDENALVMNLSYDNQWPDKIMSGASFMRINFMGRPEGGGYSMMPDENGVITQVFFALEKGDGRSLNLRVMNPIYYFTAPYRLSLGK
ncbi:MAG: hypothetical protein AAGU12_09095 [Clostridiales bacterium]